MNTKYNQTEPVYRQVQGIILERIESGAWPVHSKIPDEITLAQSLGISRGTLRRAIRDLTAQGVLTQIRGRGTFVVSNHIEQHLASRLVSFSESMTQQGLNYKTLVLKKEIIQPDIKIAAFLELPPGERVNYIERVRLVDQVPIIYLKNYIPLSCGGELMTDDLEHNTLFQLLEQKYGHRIQWGRRYFKAVPAMGDVVHNLGVDITTPVMYLEQIIYSEASKPIECSNVWINSDRFDIVSILNR